MSLFSFLRKNKQEPAAGDSEFYSRAEEESAAVRGRGRRKSGKQSKSENAPVDPVLPEKKRARRRLVGAVALVLAVIIGLPMVLDSEPKPLAEDIAIQIPSKDKPYIAPSSRKPSSSSANIVASSTLDAKEEFVDPSGVDALKEAPAKIAAAAPAAPAAKPKDAAKPAPAKSVVAQKTEPKAEPKPVQKAPPKPESDTESKPEPSVAKADKPVEKSPAKADDTVRAKSILEAKPNGDVDAAAEKKPVKFSVQVAALASAEKVSELQEKLKTAGIRSYTQKVTTASGERIRIRVGPYASKEEADRVKSKLSGLGLNGTVVPLNL